MRARALVMVGSMAVALVTGACGDDDDSGAGGGDGEELTREGYIEAADALCLGFVEETEALEEPEDVDEAEDYLRTTVELAEDVVADFAALEPPAEAADVHATLRSAIESSTARAREALEALEAGDIEAMQTALEDAADLGDDSDEAAKAFGMQVCGSEAELRDE